ncbi:MAG: sigma-70 family RNA polymerase sigma factor [Nannocystaceae bacterium]
MPSGASVMQLAPSRPCTARVVPCRPVSVTPEQIKLACQGDRHAIADLVDALLPVVKVEVAVALRRRASAAGRDPQQDVDDFVQDVLVHLLDAQGQVLRRWDPVRGRSLPSFVRIVTRHRIARVLEGFRGNPWRGAGEPTEDEHLEDLEADRSGTFRRLASRHQLARLLEQMRARLNERGLRLFHKIYVEQRPIGQVCEEEGMSRAAIDQWSSRLRRMVRGLAKETSE